MDILVEFNACTPLLDSGKDASIYSAATGFPSISRFPASFGLSLCACSFRWGLQAGQITGRHPRPAVDAASAVKPALVASGF
jgi:hypothetical protein